MPLLLPSIDDRRYRQLVDDALARIPIHTPEWTNFNASDPGVTLIQVFAFLTESLLYRANQIPERNRLKFLQLLGVPLQPASSARGIVTIDNTRGPLETVTLDRDLEVRAGQVSFRSERGLDVLPVEAHVCFKRKLLEQPADRKEYYRQLYASFLGDEAGAAGAPELELYELVPLAARGSDGVDILRETVDNALWIALLARPKESVAEARKALGGKTLSFGLVPLLDAEEAERRLGPVGTDPAGSAIVRVEVPSVPAKGRVEDGARPAYRNVGTFAMPIEPAVFEFSLGAADQLTTWGQLDPLEQGADDYPPALDDTSLSERLITWIRVVWPDGISSQIAWAGINATMIGQRERVPEELLPAGTGEPDQAATLGHRPVIPDSVELIVTTDGEPERWELIDDLFAAGPEVPSPNLREPPGRIPPRSRPSKVFAVDPESGRLRFGDGARGARPPVGAILRASYDYGAGRDGNVGEKAVKQAPDLPGGFQVTNPVRTWGGAEAESMDEGEKQISRYLQHRDRLVTAPDFEAITLRTPGVDLGRVDVLAACNPTLPRQEPGNAPGAVTLMLVPRFSPVRPDAPSPDQASLAAVGAWLNPRRLITTELHLRGPEYIGVWISVSIEIVASATSSHAPNSAAVVREAVKRRLREFLSPLREGSEGQLGEAPPLFTPAADETRKGWPLRRPVLRLELMAEVSRVPNVALVNELLLAGQDGLLVDRLDIKGLQLPRIDGIEVVAGGAAVPIAQLQGTASDTLGGGGSGTGGSGGSSEPPKRRVPVPVIPDEC